jgi:hypothetical protein
MSQRSQSRRGKVTTRPNRLSHLDNLPFRDGSDSRNQTNDQERAIPGPATTDIEISSKNR